ncbi:hypothetical protein SAMN05421856_103367 [Chryseobacterium taichungense]|uniref:Uncharacterized protein n=1 Tax=Chryseobacterium taichungense TaxID=295069 RepID=A0A1H7YJY6_9FLAO|nr:hypothetical protein SAMN05421856_103367 [Chryseobacterium taichungense]
MKESAISTITKAAEFITLVNYSLLVTLGYIIFLLKIY